MILPVSATDCVWELRKCRACPLHFCVSTCKSFAAVCIFVPTQKSNAYLSMHDIWKHSKFLRLASRLHREFRYLFELLISRFAKVLRLLTFCLERFAFLSTCKIVQNRVKIRWNSPESRNLRNSETVKTPWKAGKVRKTSEKFGNRRKIEKWPVKCVSTVKY